MFNTIFLERLGNFGVKKGFFVLSYYNSRVVGVALKNASIGSI
jgi:hypothetical protein